MELTIVMPTMPTMLIVRQYGYTVYNITGDGCDFVDDDERDDDETFDENDNDVSDLTSKKTVLINGMMMKVTTMMITK